MRLGTLEEMGSAKGRQTIVFRGEKQSSAVICFKLGEY